MRHTATRLLTAAVCLAACGRAELTGPPVLRPGRDECAECGMLLSEDRCAAAVLVVVDGERRHLVFDDIGCLLDFATGPDRPAPVESYVRDYGARSWVVAANAWFVAGAERPPMTPMASGLVAFGGREAAEKQAAATAGRVMSEAELMEWYRLEQSSAAGGGSEMR